jgi:hypothetical protein
MPVSNSHVVPPSDHCEIRNQVRFGTHRVRRHPLAAAGDSGRTGLLYSLGADLSYASFKIVENRPHDEDTLSFVHDGLEANRIEKIRHIARSPVIVENLRACATDEGSRAYNCGRCVACLETMIGLHIVGALDQSQTFPHGIDLESLGHGSVSNQVILDQLTELLPGLETSDRDSAIRAAVIDCSERNERNAAR